MRENLGCLIGIISHKGGVAAQKLDLLKVVFLGLMFVLVDNCRGFM